MQPKSQIILPLAQLHYTSHFKVLRDPFEQTKPHKLRRNWSAFCMHGLKIYWFSHWEFHYEKQLKVKEEYQIEICKKKIRSIQTELNKYQNLKKSMDSTAENKSSVLLLSALQVRHEIPLIIVETCEAAWEM